MRGRERKGHEKQWERKEGRVKGRRKSSQGKARQELTWQMGEGRKLKVKKRVKYIEIGVREKKFKNRE